MRSKKDIQEWLVEQVAQALVLDPTTVDLTTSFTEYGLSSSDLVMLSGDLEDFLGRRLSPTLAYEYPSIATLAEYLASHDQPQAEVKAPQQLQTNEPIAIIGMGCRFPGASDLDAYWNVLSTGQDMISEIPSDRWSKEAFYHPDPAVPGKAISKWGGFLEDIDQFDPFFFGISPNEAKHMDPQQRLLMEVSHTALDHAGLSKAQLGGSNTGVFVGISVNEYSHVQFASPTALTSHSGTGGALSIAANRISYYYDWNGPSMAIDTACSSSLTAIHLACQSLRMGESSLALAGGVNVILSPTHSIAFTKAGVLAPDGRCKTFSDQANGYVRGEGCGLVVLKPLSAALADGNRILSVIRGSAVAQDGHTNGLMAPSQESQEKLLRKAYQTAGIAPEKVQYVEAHGTGTLLGDSMEASAIGAVLGGKRSEGVCAIGSVKTNFGHLEAAAGVAGLIKVVLAMQHDALPPSLHYSGPNPHVPFEDLRVQVQNEFGSWPKGDDPKLAGVSSFGFGGTNAHLVLQEAPIVTQTATARGSDGTSFHLLPLSANSQEDLKSFTQDFSALLADNFASSLEDICYAASKRRSQYNYRTALVGESRSALTTNLSTRLQDEATVPFGSLANEQLPQLVFAFSGQGGQWFGMGKQLFQKEPIFRACLERIDTIIQRRYDWSLLSVLLAAEDTDQLEDIGLVQPAIFAVQVALVDLWKSWGITPDLVIGHSMGEVAAAYTAGILDLEDAIQVICVRSALLRSIRGQGSMLATELTAAQAEELVQSYPGQVSLAALNGPTSTVLSGDPEALQQIMEQLEAKHLFCRWVKVNVASHSPQIDSLRGEMLAALTDLQPKSTHTPIVSTVTGSRAEELVFNAHYWVDNLRKPVLFSPAIAQLATEGELSVLEIGPHPVLLGAIQQSAQEGRRIPMFPSLRREENERENLLRTLGSLYEQGFDINWDQLYQQPGQYVDLPPVRFHRQSYWIDTAQQSATSIPSSTSSGASPTHPLLGTKIDLADQPSSHLWLSSFDPATIWYLEDHQIQDQIVLPASAYLEIAMEARKVASLENSHSLQHFLFSKKMTLQKGKPTEVQIVLTPEEGEDHLLKIYSRSSSSKKWQLHVSVQFMQASQTEPTAASSPTEFKSNAMAEMGGGAFYEALSATGLQYGPLFRGVQQLWHKGQEALGQVIVPDALVFEQEQYHLHPAVLDACLQVLAAAVPAEAASDALFLPVACEQVEVFAKPTPTLWSQAILRTTVTESTDRLVADVNLYNEEEQLIARLQGLQLQRIHAKSKPIQSLDNTWLYELRWRPKALSNKEQPTSPKQWLILADDEGLVTQLAAQLESQGHSCHLLSASELLKAQDTKAYINQFINQLTAPIDGIVHLWSLSIPPQSEGSSAQMDLLGCNSVLHLIQSLSQHIASSPRLFLVTKGAQAVIEGESIAVEQSALWGLGKVISFELPEFKCVRIDLDTQLSTEADLSPLVEQLSAEPVEDQIALRAGTRFVARLVPYTPSPERADEFNFVEEATYLITGGLGGLGLASAKWMAEQGARTLVLLGRSTPSPEAQVYLEQLQQYGTAVIVAQADVSDQQQIQAVVDRIQAELPPLRGLVHAAGVLDDGALLNLDAQRMKTVMAPKVEGGWNLHLATADCELDFFVLFSSAVSVLGSPGQGNYAAASSYIDALAHYRQQLGLPGLSINWGPWAEVGLAAEATAKLEAQNASTQHLVKVIEIEEGLATLGVLLQEAAPQVAALPFDLKHLLELYPTAASMPFFAEVGGSETHVAKLYARPKLRQEYVGPSNEIERKLVELWQQTLHIDRVGINDSFFELGGDSVLAAQVLALARKTYGISINPQDAFQAFTIKRLAALLEAEIMKQISEMSEEEVLRRLAEED